MSTIFLVAFFIEIVSDLLRALRFKLGKVNLRACSQINIWGKRNAAPAKSSMHIQVISRQVTLKNYIIRIVLARVRSRTPRRTRHVPSMAL